MSEEKASSKPELAVHSVQPVSEQVFYDPSKESVWTRIGLSGESFKRAPGPVYREEVPRNSSLEEQPHETEREHPLLPEKLKSRHLQMIAVGGSIGTGLFIGSGGALAKGGPGGILFAWTVIGLMVFNTCQAMGELSIMYPVAGGFYNLSNRFIDKSWGFAMGWNYAIQWCFVLPLELTAAAFTVGFWPNDIHIAVWITMFILLVVILNVFGAIAYGEEEFWASCVKLFVVSLFIVFAVIMVSGGGPAHGEYHDYVGVRYWKNPGPFAHGFKGVCAVFVTAAFSFSGTEVVGLAVAESANPRKAMPKAIKVTFWRITVIYIISLLFIGLLIPYNDPKLVGGGAYDARRSPFVLVMERAGVPQLMHLVNFTVTLAVLSIAVSSIYAGSRTLHALGEQGYAPAIFAYVDKAGRPLVAVIFVLCFAPIAYVNIAAESGGIVFDWLLATCGLSALFTWGSICASHIRFRRAWRIQGHSVDEIPFQATFGVAGSYMGLVLVILVIVAQVYTTISPIEGKVSAETFFKSLLCLPIIIICYIAGYMWKGELPKRSRDIDLVTGRKVWDTAAQLNAERAKERALPLHRRIYNIFF